MIPNSIRWRLQLWYGLILLAVLAGFGVTAYQLERGRVLRDLNDEVLHRFSLVANALRPRPFGPGQNQGPDGPPDGPPPEEGRPDRNFRPSASFHLPAQVATLFNTNQENNFYYLIAGSDGAEIARGGVVPAHLPKIPAVPEQDGPPSRLQDRHPPPISVFDDCLEASQIIPTGELIRVGRSIAPDLRELHITAMKLAGVGGAILLVGLAGGWWLASRAIRPVTDISAAAAKISGGDLSQRISVAETESELGRLAMVLNSTFDRLESAFMQQKQFASDAAHELRTPVSVLLTQTQLALNRERSGAEYRETIEACRRAAQRMRRLIESLLELARFDAGQQLIRRRYFDLSETVLDCADSLRPIAEEKSVQIHCHLKPVKCLGDADRLSQVINNLVSNAIQYNVRGGEVRLSARSESNMAVLTVADTGPGIPAEDLPHIFKRFYRGDKSRTGSHSGLGLAISRAIVEAHGGTIGAESEPGNGAVFTIRLPAGDEKGAKPADSEAPPR